MRTSQSLILVMKKTASQMHVAPQIVVHCWQYAPDVGPDMPQMMPQTCPRWYPRHAPDMPQTMPQTCPRRCLRWCPRHAPDDAPVDDPDIPLSVIFDILKVILFPMRWDACSSTGPICIICMPKKVKILPYKFLDWKLSLPPTPPSPPPWNFSEEMHVALRLLQML